MIDKMFEGLIFEWKDGRAYHLDIDANDVTSYILTMGSHKRLEKIRECIEVVDEGGSRLTWIKGFYKDILIFAFNSGMGPSSAAIAFTEVLKKLYEGVRQGYIIRIGTAGALDKSIPRYSLVIPKAAVRNEHVSRYIVPASYPSDMDPVIYLTALQTALDNGFKLGENLFIGKVETKDDLYFQEGFHNSPLSDRLRQEYNAFERMGVLATEMEVSLLPILRDYFKGLARRDGLEFHLYVGGILLTIGGELEREKISEEEDALVKIGLETLYNINRFLRGEYNIENILRYIST